MIEWLGDPAIWASLLTLTVLEVVLGIDNLIFLSITVERLPAARQRPARMIGLSGALVLRLGLLAGISWLTGLTAPLFEAFTLAFSWRDLILIAGGLFLLVKSTTEIHHEVDGDQDGARKAAGGASAMAAAIGQIMMLDLVFSLDSIITAVGMTSNYPVMATAIVIAILVMMFGSAPVGAFIARHPTIKMLALSFLLLVGVVLVADGLDFHIPRGYLYFAIFFSIGVESLNILAKRRRERRRAAASGAG